MDERQSKLRKRAVALRYDTDTDIAPKVLAKGAGIIAEKIIEGAAENEIAVHEDAALVEDLTRLDVGENIPPELYDVVAQILVFISDLDRRETAKKRLRAGAEVFDATVLN